jgi:hypothetical protein
MSLTTWLIVELGLIAFFVIGYVLFHRRRRRMPKR